MSAKGALRVSCRSSDEKRVGQATWEATITAACEAARANLTASGFLLVADKPYQDLTCAAAPQTL